MEWEPGRAIAVLATLVVALAAAPAAQAADRYASPTGSGPGASCPQSDPCSLEDATMDASVAATDRVIVLQGTYNLTGPIAPSEAITIEGAPGQAVPRLIASGDAALRVPPSGAARRLFVQATDSGTARVVDLLAGSLGEQLEVVGFGNVANVMQVRDADLRDSSVWNRDAAGSSVVTGGGGADLHNVTAIASASGGTGVLATADFGGTQSVTLRNVIARAPASGQGIHAQDAAGDGHHVAVSVQDTNYSTLAEHLPEADIGLGSGNQTASPAFANSAAGDFHQLPNSITIDAGSADPLLGPLDIDGEPRVQGIDPDIGADEFTVAPQQPNAGDNFPPDTGIRKGPKKKTPKRKTKFEFGGSEPGVTFECRLDAGGRQGTWESCSSPHKIRGLKRNKKYVFAVRAVDDAGNPDPSPADRRWKVIKKK